MMARAVAVVNQIPPGVVSGMAGLPQCPPKSLSIHPWKRRPTGLRARSRGSDGNASRSPIECAVVSGQELYRRGSAAGWVPQISSALPRVRTQKTADRHPNMSTTPPQSSKSVKFILVNAPRYCRISHCRTADGRFHRPTHFIAVSSQGGRVRGKGSVTHDLTLRL